MKTILIRVILGTLYKRDVCMQVNNYLANIETINGLVHQFCQFIEICCTL